MFQLHVRVKKSQIGLCVIVRLLSIFQFLHVCTVMVEIISGLNVLRRKNIKAFSLQVLLQ